jgi:L-lactate dehydrogenase (cytochrome)
MQIKYNAKYPSVDDLRHKLQRKIPRFAFEYLGGWCNEDVNLLKNTTELREIELKPYNLKNYGNADMRAEPFGHVYHAPFGIALVGVQGLIHPNSSGILARAACEHTIPIVLSTVPTSSLKRISELTEGKAWFQVYRLREREIRNNILTSVSDARFPVLVIACDVSSFGYRPRDIRNGLVMPPKMILKNFFQILGKPEWVVKALLHGTPAFKTMKPYMPRGMSIKQPGNFLSRTFSGRLNEERIRRIRNRWNGKLVLKRVASEEDA